MQSLVLLSGAVSLDGSSTVGRTLALKGRVLLVEDGAHIPFTGLEPAEAVRPVRCQTFGYLPSRTASPSVDRYQLILLGDGHARV